MPNCGDSRRPSVARLSCFRLAKAKDGSDRLCTNRGARASAPLWRASRSPCPHGRAAYSRVRNCRLRMTPACLDPRDWDRCVSNDPKPIDGACTPRHGTVQLALDTATPAVRLRRLTRRAKSRGDFAHASRFGRALQGSTAEGEASLSASSSIAT